jgi:hypothetical protein
MNYDFLFLRNFLIARPLLDIAKLGQASGVPHTVLVDFIKKGSSISEKEFENIENELYEYGYKDQQNIID